MQIYITGNIASGKSFLGRKLAARYGYLYFSIDDLRKKINIASDQAGEDISWNVLKKIAQSNDRIIIESTGVSKHYESLIAISNYQKFVIRVMADYKTCLYRFENRTEIVPLPYKFDFKKSWERNEMLLKNVNFHLKCGSGDDNCLFFLDRVLKPVMQKK